MRVSLRPPRQDALRLNSWGRRSPGLWRATTNHRRETGEQAEEQDQWRRFHKCLLTQEAATCDCRLPPCAKDFSERQDYFCQVRFLCRFRRSFFRRLCLLIFALRRFLSDPIIKLRRRVKKSGVRLSNCSSFNLGSSGSTPTSDVTERASRSAVWAWNHHVERKLLHASPFPARARENAPGGGHAPHVYQYTTLFSGYSMMPSAPCALSCGIN